MKLAPSFHAALHRPIIIFGLFFQGDPGGRWHSWLAEVRPLGWRIARIEVGLWLTRAIVVGLDEWGGRGRLNVGLLSRL